MLTDFYSRDEWVKLRFRVLQKYGFKCMACGRSQKDGTVIHVDHIRPKSIFPELALREDNLQVLCRECNMGKSNRSDVDLRPIREIIPRLRVVARKNYRALSPEDRAVQAERLRCIRVAKKVRRLKLKIFEAERKKDVDAQVKLFGAYMSMMRKAAK
jgi:hypothetical protein